MQHLFTIILILSIVEISLAQKPEYRNSEDFSAYRQRFSFQRESLDPVTYPPLIEIILPFDTLAQHADITEVLNKMLAYIKPKPIGKPSIRKFEGWRVQIYRGKSREAASKARQRSYELFPHITPYMEYSAPTYRVRVGDFLEIYEYQPILKRLKREFPTAVAVPALIEIIVVGDDDPAPRNK
jgi:hypothetical protein